MPWDAAGATGAALHELSASDRAAGRQAARLAPKRGHVAAGSESFSCLFRWFWDVFGTIFGACRVLSEVFVARLCPGPSTRDPPYPGGLLGAELGPPRDPHLLQLAHGVLSCRGKSLCEATKCLRIFELLGDGAEGRL